MSLWHLSDPFEYFPFPESFFTRDVQNWYNNGYFRPWRSISSKQDSGSTVAINSNKYQVNLDVQQFRPEEIIVKAIGDNILMVEGKHDEKEDEHGSIYRHFVRKYVLPEGHDINRVESKLTSDGILIITAPRISNESGYRDIPIVQTGQASREVPNQTTPGEKGDK